MCWTSDSTLSASQCLNAKGKSPGSNQAFQERTMRSQCIFVVVLVACSGCVTAPLEHYTLNQSLSVSEMRYQEVVNALAVVAHNPGNLPSYTLNAGGVANVSAMVSLDESTQWTRAVNGFAQQMLNLTGKHSPDLSWQLNPVAEQPLLEGAWYACQWALEGPFAPGTKQFELLRYPNYDDIVACSHTVPRQYHLAVLDEYCQIPCGWLGVGKHCAPHGACYQAHCGETFVWVMPENLPSLSEFTLVLLDIATIDPNWLALQLQQPVASVQRNIALSDGATKASVTETWSACQNTLPPTPSDPYGNKGPISVAPFADLPVAKDITLGSLTTSGAFIQDATTYSAPAATSPATVPAATLPALPLPPGTVHTYRR
jgi:hypothetical protein